MAITFDTTPEERTLIRKIADRAVTELECCRLDVMMDFSALIAQGHRMRLQGLLDADSFNFAHDVCGIDRHLNRKTGKLENNFFPRFSLI